MRQSYLDYAMSVIVQRALPDARDGLKPVHRRVLYAMHQMGMRANTRYRKSAGIVGEVIKNFHPHSDTAAYDTLVRMAQTFSLRYPLVDGQGNFGSVDGDRAAAMRYTEAKMTSIAEEMMADINKRTVDEYPNYDATMNQPTVLPSRIPNMLINGSAGIAVGMATNIPPHNLNEICDAVSYMIDNPEATLEELLPIVPGPDFPTGGTILGREGIQAAYATGRGRVVIRAKAFIEDMERGNRSQIIVTELPYQVNKATLLERMAEMVRDGKLDGISNLRDESDRSGMRMVIELKRDAQPRKVLNNLFKHTALQQTFGVNMLALVERGTQPRVLTLKRALQEFVSHRQEVITRRTEFELERAQHRAHFEDVCPMLGALKFKLGTAGDHFLAVRDELLEGPLERQDTWLGAAFDKRQHVDAEGLLQRRVLEQVVQHLARLRVALELDHHTHAGAVGFVPQVRDAVQLAVAHHLRHTFEQGRLVDLIGELSDDDLASVAALHIFDERLGSNHHPAPTGGIGGLYAFAPQNRASGGEVRTWHDRQQLLEGRFRIVNHVGHRVTNLVEVVWRDVRRHADGDSGAAVDQHIRDS